MFWVAGSSKGHGDGQKIAGKDGYLVQVDDLAMIV